MKHKRFIDAVLMREDAKAVGLTVQEILRPNEDEYMAFVATKLKQGDVCVSPCIDVDELYERCHGIPANWKHVFMTFRNSSKVTVPVLNRETILAGVKPYVLQYRGNESYVNNKVYTRFLNLVVLYELKVAINEYCSDGVTLTQELLNRNHITVGELHSVSLQNLKKDVIVGSPLEVARRESFKKLSDFNSTTELLNSFKVLYADVPFMFILTQTPAIHGAGTILLTEVMQEIAEYFQSDLLILPSSIHEIIIVVCGSGDWEFAKTIVEEVNSNNIAVTDILTDTVYQYNIKTNKVETL